MKTRQSILAPCGLLLATLVSVAPCRAQSSALKTLYSFMQPPDGAYPEHTLTLGDGGVLFGSTYGGGNYTCGNATSGCGTVFALIPPASTGAPWTEGIVYSFSATTSGQNPLSSVIINTNGVIYGTASGGTFDNGTAGVVYSLTPPATPGSAWTETVLHTFAGYADGFYPNSLVMGSGGVLYGTTLYGGTANAGTVYSLAPPASPGGAWTKAILYNFSTAGAPNSLVMGTAGAFYGTATGGGSGGSGVVFSLIPPATSGGAWTEHVLYNFKGGADGNAPVGPLVIGAGGVLYGATIYGGAVTKTFPGWGTVFSLTPPVKHGASWSETVIHTFTGGPDGGEPLASVSIDTNGVLYGVTNYGGTATGTSGFGTLYSLTPPAGKGAWKLATLHAFTGGADGGYPIGGLLMGGSGALYGTTQVGGAGWGTVFSAAP